MALRTITTRSKPDEGETLNLDLKEKGGGRRLGIKGKSEAW